MAHVREIIRTNGSAAYEVRWRANGNFKQRTFAIRREAERFALKVENQLAEGDSTELLVKRGRTVAEVIEESMIASAPQIKERTHSGYRALYDRRIIPEFGKRRVGSITRAEVEAWLAKLAGEGLADGTVHHHFVALKKALRHAQNDRVILYNPCDGVKVAATPARTFKPVFLTSSQVGVLSAHLDASEPYGLLVRFAAYTGLRAGEIAGLRIGDVDLAGPQVEVRQTLQRIAGEWRAGTPKSARSTRNVPLVNRALISELREYLVRHPNSGNPAALFWPGRALGSHAVDWNGVLDVGSFRRNYFRGALKVAGLPEMRFHDLRHTYASIMLDAGYEPRKVSHWLGHANLNTTDMIYGHLYPADYSLETARMDAYLGARKAGVI